jgi:hypothetical protein
MRAASPPLSRSLSPVSALEGAPAITLSTPSSKLLEASTPTGLPGSPSIARDTVKLRVTLPDMNRFVFLHFNFFTSNCYYTTQQPLFRN